MNEKLKERERLLRLIVYALYADVVVFMILSGVFSTVSFALAVAAVVGMLISMGALIFYLQKHRRVFIELAAAEGVPDAESKSYWERLFPSSHE